MRHARWVRIAHGIVTASFLTLAVTGVVILMAHPRLYWGEAGNDLTPAILELPISRNYRHGGYEGATSFAQATASPISANRTYSIFNQNGWGRSLHFIAAWLLVVPGVVYLLAGVFGGHFRSHIWPGSMELAPRHLWRDIANHLRLRIPPATGGPRYSVLQKCVYSFVVFAALPLMGLSGLAMSPALTAAFPPLRLFGGYQSARTIHFFIFIALLLFLMVHVVMVVKSGFRRQMRGMIVGD